MQTSWQKKVYNSEFNGRGQKASQKAAGLNRPSHRRGGGSGQGYREGGGTVFTPPQFSSVSVSALLTAHFYMDIELGEV